MEIVCAPRAKSEMSEHGSTGRGGYSARLASCEDLEQGEDSNSGDSISSSIISSRSYNKNKANRRAGD